MITLQEISGYLPYRLKAVLIQNLTDEYSECDWADLKKFEKGKIWELAGYADKDLCIPLGEGEINGFLFRNDFTYTSFHYGYKFLFRPLSDLTKEIEVNGEKFVPIIELAKIAFVNSPQFVIDKKHVNIGHQYSFYYDYTVNSFNCLAGYDGKKYDYACFVPNQLQLFQNLFEWHFDVFCLIERGDAIDINTLK